MPTLLRLGDALHVMNEEEGGGSGGYSAAVPLAGRVSSLYTYAVVGEWAQIHYYSTLRVPIPMVPQKKRRWTTTMRRMKLRYVVRRGSNRPHRRYPRTQ